MSLITRCKTASSNLRLVRVRFLKSLITNMHLKLQYKKWRILYDSLKMMTRQLQAAQRIIDQLAPVIILCKTASGRFFISKSPATVCNKFCLNYESSRFGDDHLGGLYCSSRCYNYCLQQILFEVEKKSY